jgi:hypothetical protein
MVNYTAPEAPEVPGVPGVPGMPLWETVFWASYCFFHVHLSSITTHANFGIFNL